MYDNGERGEYRLRDTYKFEKNGNVYNKTEIGKSTTFDTKGCALYYKLSGSSLIIYHGVKGWKKSAQHTEYSKGEYHVDYIVMKDDRKYLKQ